MTLTTSSATGDRIPHRPALIDLLRAVDLHIVGFVPRLFAAEQYLDGYRTSMVAVCHPDPIAWKDAQ